jgi:vanillate O-demethylase ferredoxin subunit
MGDMLSVIVDGLWRQGNKSLAVRLVAENGEALPDWQPGAHIDVHLPCGIVRQYSLTGPCGDEGYLICVGRETASRGGSRYIHETLRPGQRLLISSSRNVFPLHQAERVLLLAAGIGITPLYAMALQLEASGTPSRCTITSKVVKVQRLSASYRVYFTMVSVLFTPPARRKPARILPGSVCTTCGITCVHLRPAEFMAKVREVATANAGRNARSQRGIPARCAPR